MQIHMVVPIEVPFNPEALELDPSSRGAQVGKGMEALVDHYSWADDAKEVEEVMCAAVVLFYWGQGRYTFGECLDTALVWSRG